MSSFHPPLPLLALNANCSRSIWSLNAAVRCLHITFSMHLHRRGWGVFGQGLLGNRDDRRCAPGEWVWASVKEQLEMSGKPSLLISTVLQAIWPSSCVRVKFVKYCYNLLLWHWCGAVASSLWLEQLLNGVSALVRSRMKYIQLIANCMGSRHWMVCFVWGLPALMLWPCYAILCYQK